MLKLFFYLLSILLLVTLQTSLLPALGSFFKYLNLPLVILIFLVIIIDYKITLFLALGSGFLLDLYQPSFFYFISLTLLVTLLVVNFLLKNFLTNRSFFSLLILGLGGILLYEAILLVSSKIFSLLFLSNLRIVIDHYYLMDFFKQIIFNLGLGAGVLIFFRLLNEPVE